MSISTIRRQVKNVAYNFSDAQIKVREATSNDPWGPSMTLMSQIADLTWNSVAFNEIMSIVWRRLNDSGKNWRHVYKSLILIDVLVKAGHEKVAQQCRENIFTIETLKDFQYVDENKDQGRHIRTKAEYLTALLKDSERLKNERMKYIVTRDKMKASAGGGAGGNQREERATPTVLDPEYEEARPTNATEEDLQLQIALALSKEESEQSDELAKSDDARLQMALEESQKTVSGGGHAPFSGSSAPLTQSALDDLLSLGLGTDPWIQSSSSNQMDPWSNGMTSSSSGGGIQDPFESMAPLAPINGTSSSFDLLGGGGIGAGGDLLCPSSLMDCLQISSDSPIVNNRSDEKVLENFLGENKNLVNFDNLLERNLTTAGINPFLTAGSSTSSSSHPSVSSTNPFLVQNRKSPTLNEMIASSSNGITQKTIESNPFANPF